MVALRTRQVAIIATWYTAEILMKLVGKNTSQMKTSVDTDTKIYQASLKFSGSLRVRKPNTAQRKRSRRLQVNRMAKPSGGCWQESSTRLSVSTGIWTLGVTGCLTITIVVSAIWNNIVKDYIRRLCTCKHIIMIFCQNTRMIDIVDFTHTNFPINSRSFPSDNYGLKSGISSSGKWSVQVSIRWFHLPGV